LEMEPLVLEILVKLSLVRSMIAWDEGGPEEKEVVVANGAATEDDAAGDGVFSIKTEIGGKSGMVLEMLED
jgi:hypothetical protein